MKIASQLLSTTPSTASKAATLPDNVGVFHGVLSTAAAKSSKSDEGGLPKAKLPAQDAKSQTPEIKKKFVASDTSIALVTAPDISASNQLPVQALTQLSNSLSPTHATPTQPVKQVVSYAPVAAESSTGQPLRPTSSASDSVVVKLPTNLATTGWTSQNLPDQNRTATGSAETADELPVVDGAEELLYKDSAPSSAPSIAQPVAFQSLQTQSDNPSAADTSLAEPRAESGSISLAVLPAAKTVAESVPVVSIAEKAVPSALVGSHKTGSAPAIAFLPVAAMKTDSAAPVAATKPVPSSSAPVSAAGQQSVVAEAPIVSGLSISHIVGSKAAATDLNAPVSKASDTSNPSPIVPVIDSTPSATQQAAAAIVQNAVAPVSLSGMKFADESQAAYTVGANQAPMVGRVANAGNEMATRHTASAAKAKPTFGVSVSGSSFADSSDTTAQTEGLSTGTASQLPKGSEATATANQTADSNEIAVGIANQQQMPQAGPANGSDHTPELSQSGSVSAGSAVQTAPAQAVPDHLPMQGISSAQLVQSVRSSEMKLGMQSPEFGNISISTSLIHQTLSAQISIDHSELGRALAVHLPAIEEKIGSAYGVQARVELRDSNNSASSGDSGYSNSGQQSREQRQSQGGGANASHGVAFKKLAARTNFTQVSTTATVSRLDVRA